MALGRAARGWTIAVVVVVVVTAVLVIVDAVVRASAQERIAENVEAQLPDGVTGDVTAEIGGFSVLWQSIVGTAERVELHARELTVDGAPIAVDVVGTDVPLDQTKPVGRITGTITVDEASLNTLAVGQGVDGGFTLGDGSVGYDGEIEFLGFPIRYSATATPEAAGDRILLRPTAVEAGAGGASIDLSGIADRILGGDPFTVCTAEYLPEGVEVADVAVAPGSVVIGLEASGLVLDEAHLAARGSCD
ncbi:DUF2993 domain-containing protein [Agromyces sp. LHK192]|uniref:LmeA family phospholipid-binding protein n=1 Tax=Agromyces sp. LHK192 TaxID=2498704 RepID=UPI000FDB71F2|nr:DUF2993 domain-containing protein [Agromyces sp. LHK192]